MKMQSAFIIYRALGLSAHMVSLEGTNPVSGESVDATSPSDWKGYIIGGVMLVGGVVVGKFVTDTASEATSVGDSVSDTIMELS